MGCDFHHASLVAISWTGTHQNHRCEEAGPYGVSYRRRIPTRSPTSSSATCGTRCSYILHASTSCMLVHNQLMLCWCDRACAHSDGASSCALLSSCVLRRVPSEPQHGGQFHRSGEDQLYESSCPSCQVSSPQALTILTMRF